MEEMQSILPLIRLKMPMMTNRLALDLGGGYLDGEKKVQVGLEGDHQRSRPYPKTWVQVDNRCTGVIREEHTIHSKNRLERCKESLRKCST